MNPFTYGLNQPVAAFSDLAVLSMFVGIFIVGIWMLTGNVVWLVEENRTGGWDILPPTEFMLRVALVPFGVAILAWLVGAMFAMLG